jgi:pseudouridine synthase
MSEMPLAASVQRTLAANGISEKDVLSERGISMSRYLLLNKPFNVLSSFTDPQGRATLADYVPVPGVYAAGRLDYDSEGLLLLTDDGELIHRLTDPRHEHPKTYYVQLEGLVTEEAAAMLAQGVVLRGLRTRPAEAEIITDPGLPARPVPVRAYHPTSWLKVILREGQKRQLRRMTAAVGFPTLRLVRWAIGPLTLDGLAPGEWRELKRLESNFIQK